MRFLGLADYGYSRSSKVGNPIASILKSHVQGIPALFDLNPVSNFTGFTVDGLGFCVGIWGVVQGFGVLGSGITYFGLLLRVTGWGRSGVLSGFVLL